MIHNAMADYITANRWITGVATHKTNRGPILCTGVGCVGCFPQDFPKIACELEVYDCKTGMLFAESWTNEHSNKSTIETESQGIKPAKRRCCIKKKITRNNELKTDENLDETESDLEKSTGSNRFFLTEHEDDMEDTGEKESCVDNEKSPSARDEDGLEERNFSEKPTTHDRFRIVDREDCVCLFFALEYNHNSRKLSEFSILEIASSLTTIMHVNEIKCVQRLNGLWHIMLRTRAHLMHLLTNGLRIRGKWYRVIQDNNLYCEKVF